MMILKAPILLMAPLALLAHDLMPAPAKVQMGQGRLRIDRNFSFIQLNGYREPRLEAAAARLVEHVALKTGIPMNPGVAGRAPEPALVVYCDHASAPPQTAQEDESYRLTVTPLGARLDAPNPLGVLHGFETVLQLVDLDASGFGIPAVTIEDRPRFPWRGLMLDVARHWIPLNEVLRTLDGMAAVKLNVFHWHLSENQGFRVESRAFPKLHEMGSDGDYYTQDQVREVIAYARDRGIRVIPEFDMPGHSTAWFVGYPELASAAGPYHIERDWGIFDPAMDPTREETYQFLDTFIGEMTGLFPDEYFHIGGDEVNGKQWDANPRVQAFMREQGLKSNEALQAYFTRRVQALVAKHGKKMIGWDEILTPDMPHSILVQSWRGPKSLADAARQGVHSILSNGYYLDLGYDAAHHYAVDPLGAGAADLSEEQKKLVLGGEACMWSEFVTPEVLDLRVWPRAAAVAERLWSPQNVTDEPDMYRRLAAVSRDLEWLGLTHVSERERMLERLAGGGPVGPVRVLAEVVEPVKDYARGEVRHYDSFSPYIGLVDTLPGTGEVPRRFAELVDSGKPEDLAKIREWLTLWRDNDAKLEPLMAHSTLLARDAEISKDLSAIAAAGLQALDGGHPAAGWTDQQKALLERAARQHGELLLSVAAPIRKLIETAK
ncbi:MAG TPA: family 20 glycosylhydrolase [Bryobacteraceae bacterium]|nr:family 20 glycosylhydrolase [Bryobacteraceae bacterium]